MDIIYNVTQREVAVIVARFQIDNLHSAHIELINIILNTHKRIIIVLGLSPLKCTAKNPLDFQMRKQMILDNFKDKHKYITIVYLQDCKTNQEWSDKLDIIIKKNTNNETVRLCGGRDSFIPYYTNKYETWTIKEFSQSEYISATSVRNDISNSTSFSSDFRRGVIYTANNINPRCVPAVDVAIFDNNLENVLLCQIIGEDKYSFIGAWVQSNETYEEAANNAVLNKATIKVDNLKPLKSFTNFDWRFRAERDNLTTMLYSATLKSGEPFPRDNIVKLNWIKLDNILDYISDTHYTIASYLRDNINN